MIEGIDVSNWQGKIDWAKVAKTDAKFCYIKATEGVAYTNPNFSHDWKASKTNHVLRGAYHFFDPTKSAEDQVDHFLDTVGSQQEDQLPPMLDLEGNKWNSIPSQARIPMVTSWLDGVEHKLGVAPMIYLGFYFARDVLKTVARPELSRYRLWLANYNNVVSPRVPEPWMSWTLWQYTSSGSVDGIEGKVDKNKFVGTLDDLKKLGRTHLLAHT